MATAKKRPGGGKKASAQSTAKLAKELAQAGAAGKKKLAAALAAIRKLQGEGTQAFDELWEQVRDVLEAEPPLWRHGGYETESDFICRELPGETLRSVKRNILVASCFTPRDEAEKGISFLEELALYAQERSGASRRPAAIDLSRMFIAVPAGKVGTLRKRAKDASIDDVRKARRALRAEGATSKRSSKEEKALRAALAKVVALRGVTVVLRGGQVSLGSVPLDEKTLRALGRALATVKLPS